MMQIRHSTPQLGSSEQVDDPRRDHPRFGQQAVRSNLGRVLDLGPGGARIETDRMVHGDVTMQLYAMDRAVDVRGRVIWSQRRAGFVVELGIAFTDVSRRDMQAIEHLARRHRIRRCA